MEKFGLIIIGEMAGFNLESFKNCLPFCGEIRQVPFVDATKEPEWIERQSKSIIHFAGIGPGAAGCLIGHRRAWELVIKERFDYALILESDATLTKYGKRHLAKFLRNIAHYDFNVVHLGTHQSSLRITKVTNVLRWNLYSLSKLLVERVFLLVRNPTIAKNRFPFSTHAYTIKFGAATELLSIEPDFRIPVDVLLNGYSQVEKNKIGESRTPLIVQNSDKNSLTKKFGR